MSKHAGSIALECFVDLGITIFYAALAGLLIVAVVSSDDGAPSLLASLVYASLLPLAVAVLIGFDAGLRIFADRRRRLRADRAYRSPKTLSSRTLA